MNDDPILDGLIDIARRAGDRIMEIYAAGFEVEEKADASPVTDADAAAEAVIFDGLTALSPETSVLAEEAASEGRIPELGARFFLVDPLDGTKEFIKRTGEFTVNIALVEDGRPVAGVVLAPATGRLHAGRVGVGAFVEAGPGAAREAIRARPKPDSGLVAVASRSHRSPETDAFLESMNVADFTAAGSSLKFCLVAEGAADVYPRLGRTMEWDTGAGQAVLEAAGGRVVVHGGETPLAYGKAERGFDNPHFVAWGA